MEIQITVCPDCRSVAFGHPNYCRNCGRNLSDIRITQLTDYEDTCTICPACAEYIPVSSNYCPNCGGGIRYPYNHMDKDICKSGTILPTYPSTEYDEQSEGYTEELYGAPWPQRKGGDSDSLITGIRDQPNLLPKPNRENTDRKKKPLIQRLFPQKSEGG